MRQARDAFGIGVDTINRRRQKLALSWNLRYPLRKRSFRKLYPEKLKAYIEERLVAYRSEIVGAFGAAHPLSTRPLAASTWPTNKNQKV